VKKHAKTARSITVEMAMASTKETMAVPMFQQFLCFLLIEFNETKALSLSLGIQTDVGLEVASNGTFFLNQMNGVV
jgi:hypothetical protein